MDTQYFTAAFLLWQQKNGVRTTYELLTQAQRSEIMREAQTMKAAAKWDILTVEEVIAKVERRNSQR